MAKKPTISEKHGLNPSINVCFFCGKDKEVVLFGKLKNDIKAPKRILADYQPCAECAKMHAKGRLVIEVVTTDTGSMPIMPGAWPTGRWCVLDKGVATRLFRNSEDKPMLLEQSLYSAMMQSRKKLN